MAFPTVRGAAAGGVAGVQFPAPQGPRTAMKSVTPHQLSPMGRQLLKAHMMRHAVQLHQRKMQMTPHMASYAPGATTPFQPSSPMLGDITTTS